MSAESTGVLARLRQPVGGARKARQRVGGTPQVTLLPREVREAGAIARHRRALVALVVAVAVAAGIGVAAAQQVDTSSQQRLADAQARAQALAVQTAKFQDIRKLEAQIAAGKAAVRVGSSTMIDWQTQIDAIEAGLPSGYTVTNISANGATPLVAYPQGKSLLEPARVATISITVTSSTFGPEFSAWIHSLGSVPAYADSTSTTSYDTSTSTYTTVLTVHLTPKALAAGTWTALK
ncbi:hypothetical protein [Amnibacterium sp.]|uniref:hypothetical protein n=1 Tax=Amnibacterium sp. TaxID=1872496 RepID=UPI003F7C195D